MLPDGVPAVGSPEVTLGWNSLGVSLPVIGAPGATVRVTYAGEPLQDVVLDGSGAATVVFDSSYRMLLRNSDLTLTYVARDEVGETSTVSLLGLLAADLLDAIFGR